MRLSSCLLIACLHIQTCLGQGDKYTDENRPYKFGFNIEGYQHRQEEKDEKGLIKGEYGFITADGYYRVTVYATDENGDFRIISMKNYYVGFPPEDPQTTPQPPTQPGQGFQLPGRGSFQSQPNPLSTPVRAREKEGRREKDPLELIGLTACSDCLIPTTKKPGQVGTRFGAGRGGDSPGFGPRNQGGQGFGGGSGGDGPVFGARTRGNTGGSQGGFGGSGGGRGSDGGAPGRDRGFGGTPGSGGFGGAPGGRGTPNGRGNARFGGTGSGGPTGRGGARGQLQNDSPNRGTGDGSTLSGGGRPEVGSVRGGLREVGSVRDGLPRGVSVDDIKALLYTFNYTVGFHGHHEDGYRNGDKEGDYFFDGRDGVERKVEYIANEFGYQPNITFIDLPENDVRRPKEETEKEYGLKGYEFKWFYRK